MLVAEVKEHLARIYDPYLEKEWGEAQIVKAVEIIEDRISIALEFGYPVASDLPKLEQMVSEKLKGHFPPDRISLTIETKILPHSSNDAALLPGIKNIIGIASGKGGVGKSLIALNLALALKQAGAKVGLFDADIYGPSQPILLHTEREKAKSHEGKLTPITQFGIETMSMGYVTEETAPIAWRGPMLGKAVEQFLHQTAWQALDYLIVDLPPGTGDVQLTLCQKMPISGVVMVTTGELLAFSDVRRASEMFKQLSIPLLGVVENMSHYHCPQCGAESHIFGEGAGEQLANAYNIPLFMQMPLHLDLRVLTEEGKPPALHDKYAEIFNTLALKVAAKVTALPRSYRLPKVKIAND